MKNTNEHTKFLLKFGLPFVIVSMIFLAMVINNINRFPHNYSQSNLENIFNALKFGFSMALIFVGLVNGIRLFAKYIKPQISNFSQKYRKAFNTIIIFSFITMPIISAVMFLCGMITSFYYLCFLVLLYCKSQYYW